jgi:hypothetical protein
MTMKTAQEKAPRRSAAAVATSKSRMLPKKIKVGPQVFEVIERSHKEDGMLNDGSYGYTLDIHNTIVIDKDIHHSKKGVTLLHEVMHAARMVFENPTKPKKNAEFEEWEHHFIGIWENSLLMILRDNPDLVEYLLKEN